jgi:hypothetical protein
MTKHQVRLMLSPTTMNFESSSPPISHPVFPTSFDAVNFAYRLSKISTFFPAAYELLSLFCEYKYIISTRKVCDSILFFLLLKLKKQCPFDRPSGF